MGIDKFKPKNELTAWVEAAHRNFAFLYELPSNLSGLFQRTLLGALTLGIVLGTESTA